MLSMRTPLGRSDPRVSEVDPPIDYILSPSFASVLEFSHQRFERELSSLDLDTKWKQESVSSSPSEPYTGQRRLSTTKSNFGIDKYFDGVYEPMNPQNTPADYDSLSAGEVSHKSTIHKHTSSAPQMKQLNINWFHDKPENSFLYEVSEGVKTPSAQQRSVSLGFSSRESSEIDPCDQSISPMKAFGKRCVRFSPAMSPLESSSQQHLLPSVEPEEDYIGSYQRQRLKENWKAAISRPKRDSFLQSNPGNTLQFPMKVKNRQAEICFSPLSKVVGQDEGSSIASNITVHSSCEGNERNYFFNFQAALYQIQIGSPPRPLVNLQFQSLICKKTMKDCTRKINVRNHPSISGVLLRITLPPCLIHLLLAVVEKLGQSREGRVVLSIVTLAWVWFARFVNYFLSLFGLWVHTDHDFGPFWGMLLGVWPAHDQQGPECF